MSDPLKLARTLIGEQSDALSALAAQLDDSFKLAVDHLLAARDQMVVTGIGKSGVIARKAAATLSSTGTPAIFMHPVEGLHGDLGVVSPQSVLLALSKGGNTEELIRFVGHFRRLGGSVIAITEDTASPLAELAEVVLAIPCRPESGPLALAPTTSTLMMLALCDALAMVLLDARGFSEADFARYHPEGSLGRRLLTRVADLMHAGPEMPCVKQSALFSALLLEMTSKRLGMTCIADDHGGLVGVFTDGDLRRLLTRCESPTKISAMEAWRQSRRDPAEPPVRCSTVSPHTLAVDCLKTMRDSEITVLVVSSDGHKAEGVIRLQDLVRAGL